MPSTISIIEDNIMCQKVLRKIIETRTDCLVDKIYNSAEDAVEMTNTPPDIAIVDYDLPGMNGIEFVKMIKSKVPGILCLMYSSHEDEQIVLKAFEYGASGYISKKSSPEQVSTTIKNLKKGLLH